MYYDIIFDGASCPDIRRREYKSDMHALNKAWSELESQPYPPEHGQDIATEAKVYTWGPGVLDVELFATVRDDGMIEFARAE